MSDMLGISSGAIGAYQRALTTVSNNIANVNTEGYSRQDVVLADSAPKQMASMYIGTGVMLQTIKRQFDAFANRTCATAPVIYRVKSRWSITPSA